MKGLKFKFGGKVVWEKMNGRLVRVQLPPEKGPAWKDVKPIFEEMARIDLEKRKSV